jgi:hypothetical protein
MGRLWSTAALVVVLGGLGAYIYFDLAKQSDSASGSKQEKVFPSLGTDKINELKIKSESGDVTTVKKDGSAWQVVAPITAKASESDVSSITSALGNLEITRVIEEKPSDVKEYGLDKPQIDVEFKASDGKSGHLAVGQKTSTGSGLYARRGDDPKVFLIPAYQESTFNKSTFDLRDKALLTFQRDKVDGISVTADGKAIELAKEGADWKLTKPLAARADNSAVEGLVGRLETTQMKSVAANDPTPDDLKKYGLDKPAATITLSVGSARATLLIGGKADDDNVYARDASKPSVVTVEKSLVDDAKKSADDYRRKDVFEFRAFNATRVELTKKGQAPIVFERVKGEKDKPDTWRRVSPNPGDADREKVEKLLADLADVRVTSFVESTAKTGLDAPLLVVDAKFDEGKKEEKVSFGQNGSDVYVARPGDPGAGKIEGERLTEALKQLDEVAK